MLNLGSWIFACVCRVLVRTSGFPPLPPSSSSYWPQDKEPNALCSLSLYRFLYLAFSISLHLSVIIFSFDIINIRFSFPRSLHVFMISVNVFLGAFAKS